MEYAFLVQPRPERLDAAMVHKALKDKLDGFEAATVAAHSEPWVAFVRVSRSLSDAEKAMVGDTISAI